MKNPGIQRIISTVCRNLEFVVIASHCQSHLQGFSALLFISDSQRSFPETVRNSTDYMENLSYLGSLSYFGSLSYLQV